jgi:signal transduction histidine kinase
LIIKLDSKFIAWLLEKRSRIIIAGILAVVSPLLALSLYIYLQVNSEFQHIVISENETLLNLTAYHLEEKINTEISNAKTFADRPLVIKALKTNDPKALIGHLKNFIGNSLSIEKVIITNPLGIGIAVYPEDSSVTGLDFSDKDWYRGVSAQWRPYVSDFFLRVAEPQRYLFAIAVPVKEENGNILGIMVFHPKEDYFMDELSGMSIGSGFIYVVDKNGHLIYHPAYKMDRIYDFSGVPAVEKVKRSLSGVEKGIDPVGKGAVISAFRPMKWEWGIILQRPEKEVLQPVRSIVIGLVIFTGLSLLVGIFIAYDGMHLLYSIRSLSVKLQDQERIEKEMNAQLQVELAERRLAEEKLGRTLIDLERSNKELEQFAYVASHDLQEPLRKVGSFTELLERRYKTQLGPDADRYIDYIVDGAKRMSMLINDLLTFSRIGTRPKQFAKTDCNTVLHRTLDDLQYRIRESGAIITNDDLPVLMADETQIGLVFQNLISNAIKFRGDEPPRVHLSSRREGGVWIFSVSDNGIGIEPAYFERIFVMFQRLHAKSEYLGTGIGLAICKKVVERHGGRIWVESAFGKGSTFYFTIPEELREVVET